MIARIQRPCRALVFAVALAAAATGCDSGSRPRSCPFTIAYRDVDGDGRGSEASGRVELCEHPAPSGYSDFSDDCDDGDAAAWALRTVYRDGDADGRGGAAVTLCLGDGLPSGHAAASDDCDDADAERFRGLVRYPDRDGDGVGTSPRDVRCVGATLPGGEPLPGAGWSVFGWDPDDANAAVTEPAEDEDALRGLAVR